MITIITIITIVTYLYTRHLTSQIVGYLAPLLSSPNYLAGCHKVIDCPAHVRPFHVAMVRNRCNCGRAI